MANVPNKIFLAKGQDSVDSEDQVLWQSVKRGNELAYSALFKKFASPLYNYGMNFLPDSDLAKDCIQELFISIWQKKESLSDVVLVKSYLFKSYRNLFFAKISKSKSEIHLDFLEEEDLENDCSQETLLILEEEAQHSSQVIHQAIQSLSRRQREAVILRFYSSMDSKQAAEVMGISVEAVHNLVSKAIHLLRDRLSR